MSWTLEPETSSCHQNAAFPWEKDGTNLGKPIENHKKYG
jgi:hypothetical protein